MSLDYVYVLLREVSVQVLCSFFQWVVSLPGVELCEFFIYYGDQPLCELSLANMFSHMVCSVFILMLSVYQILCKNVQLNNCTSTIDVHYLLILYLRHLLLTEIYL